jgi:MFS family permease
MILTAICWFFIRERPETVSHHQPKIPKKAVKNSSFAGLSIIAKNPQNWLIGMYGCMMYLPISAFAELWGVPFVMSKYGINNETASFASIMVFVGMAIGSVGGAWLSGKIQSHLKVMSMAAIGTLVFFIATIYMPNISLNTTFIFLLIGGIFNGGQILYFAAAKEINPAENSATTVGFINCLIMVSGLIFQPLVGRLIDYSWNGPVKIDGTRVYSINDYKFALSSMLLALIIGWIISCFIKETFEKEDCD